LNNTGRIYLKNLKLSKIDIWNDENKYCLTTQYRTLRKHMQRSKDKLK
jgi:hypothetical protein